MWSITAEISVVVLPVPGGPNTFKIDLELANSFSECLLTEIHHRVLGYLMGS